MYFSRRFILKYQLVFNFLKGDTGNVVSSFGEESEKRKVSFANRIKDSPPVNKLV